MTEPAAQGPTDPTHADPPEPTADPGQDQGPIDPHESEPPRSLLARIRLFFFRTTLGRTRKDKKDV